MEIGTGDWYWYPAEPLVCRASWLFTLPNLRSAGQAAAASCRWLLTDTAYWYWYWLFTAAAPLTVDFDSAQSTESYYPAAVYWYWLLLLAV